jgi:DNA-directed RNA polymerase subunit RPC12/RpoP
MPVCNLCKRELPEADAAHKTKCIECGHEWTLAEDNKSIVFTLAIKTVTSTMSASQLMRGLKNAIRK